MGYENGYGKKKMEISIGWIILDTFAQKSLKIKVSDQLGGQFGGNNLRMLLNENGESQFWTYSVDAIFPK